MQNNTSPDTNGLKAILKHNETTQPNDDLLNALKTAVPQFFDKDGNFKTDKFEDELKINNISEARDGYKLGFVGKNYARLQVGLKSETMIVPDKKYNDQPENANSGNVFITGDNLEALRHLVNAYENQIKLIYIDPPYNTGKEFIYNDKFEFNDEKLKSILGYSDEEIIRLKSIQGKSSHSAWLTFMYPRLKIAQRLLKDNGVILVSIDDNEQTNLKLLMDDVFGESNFVGQFTINSTPNARDYGHIGKMHDYALFYTKQSMIAETFLIPEEDKYFKYVDNKGGYNIHPLYNSNIAFTKNNRPNLYYPFYIYPEKKQNEFFEIGLKKEDKTIEVFPPKSQKEGIQFVWRWGKKKSMEYINQEIIGYRTEDGEYRIVQKMRNTEKIIRSLLLKKEFINRKGTAELEELFNVKFFNFPKPVSLIKLFVQATTKNNDLILDFFAGSSTTAHAVMQLNSEDGGNRKFIMVQLDEKTNPDSEARKAGYSTIDEIARKRIELAGKKILADYESDLVKQTNGWDKDIGFKHYRLVTPDVKTLEKIIEFNPEETNLIADDMIKPFEYKKTETSGLDTILTTWLIDDGYRFDTSVEEITFGDYQAHYVREATTLYLINIGWDTKALKDMLNQIGTNKLLVKTIVLYPYSFEFEAMRELKTNIKTNLDNQLNLIERY